MIEVSDKSKILIHWESVDFRKGIRGLLAIISGAFSLDPKNHFLFLFINRRKNKIKALYWCNNGFALWLKDLETGTFKWPLSESSCPHFLTKEELRNLVMGSYLHSMGNKFSKTEFRNLTLVD